jgi:hypothetical protein
VGSSSIFFSEAKFYTKKMGKTTNFHIQQKSDVCFEVNNCLAHQKYIAPTKH